MAQTIITTTITFIVSSLLGYCVSLIKSYKSKIKAKEDNEQIQNIALLSLIQSNLTNTYFAYEQMQEIPDYVYKNWNNLLKIYEKLGGDDYIHTLEIKMKSWRIVKTDILDKEN